MENKNLDDVENLLNKLNYIDLYLDENENVNIDNILVKLNILNNMAKTKFDMNKLVIYSNKLLDNEVKNKLKESIGAYINEVENIIDKKKIEEEEKKKKRKEKKDAHDALVQEQIDNYLKTIEKK